MPPSGIWAIPGVLSALKWLVGIIFGTGGILGCYYGAQAAMNERLASVTSEVRVEAVKSASCADKVNTLAARQNDLRSEIQRQLDEIRKEISRGQDAISDIRQNSVRMAVEQVAMRESLIDLKTRLHDFVRQPPLRGALSPKDGTAVP